MRKKLTLTMDRDVYDGLHRRIGSRRISTFIEGLVRPYVVEAALDDGYAAMAADTEREETALRWAEHTMKDARRGKR